MERIQLLVMKGRITGTEPTSVPPFTQWTPFSSRPELAKLLLKKIEDDMVGGDVVPESTRTTSQALTKTLAAPSEAKTKTMATSSEAATKTINQSIQREETQASFGIPTLLQIETPEKVSPDREATMLNLPVPSKGGNIKPGEEDGATRIISLEGVQKALEPYSAPAETPEEERTKSIARFWRPPQRKYVIEDGKRRLISRNTAAILAMAIMAIAYLSQQQEEEQAQHTINLQPHYHTFPYIEVNMPPRMGDQIDQTLAQNLSDLGENLIKKETPSAYIIAIKKYFYPSVGRNPLNWDTRGLLASAYLRIAEIVPRDERFFTTIEKILLPGPPKNQWTADYSVGRAEYYIFLNRLDQAQETIDSALHVRPTTELLYQRARIAYEKREIETALSMISKSITMQEDNPKVNPRHLLLYVMLLDIKGQKDVAKQALKRLVKESPNYGPGIIYFADSLAKENHFEQARIIINRALENPGFFDRIQLADAFLLTAKILEGLNDGLRAILFANAADKIHFNHDLVQGLLFQIMSRKENTRKAYSNLVTGRQREKSKQTELAINSYVSAVEENRNDPIPYMALANLFEEKGDIYEAIDRYKKALDTPARPLEAALQLARIYIDRFQLDDAKAMLNIAIDMRKGSPDVAFLQGMIHLKAKQPDLADANFEKALKMGSRNPNLYIQLGKNAAEVGGNQKLAEFYYSIALRYDPLSPRAMLGVSTARFYLESPSRAISFLKDKLTLQPNSAPILTNLAAIYLQSGDQDSGKTFLQNAIRSDSKYAEAFRLLGNLTKREGDRQNDNFNAKKHSYRYALAAYEMYSKLAPNDPEGYKSTGDLYFDIRDLGAAAKNYYRVLELTPHYPEVRLRLAQISRNGGDPNKAMELIEQEIKVSPRSDAALVEKGNILMAKRDFVNASEAYTQAARLNEKNPDALFGLGVVHHLQGSFDNALSLFARVIKLDPLKADVYFQMGLIYQKQNNRQKAIQEFVNYKGVIRDAAGQARADEKIRELQRK